MRDTSTHLYALALGSNRPMSCRLSPERLIGEAIRLVAGHVHVIAQAPVIHTPPIGPSTRVFANSAILIATPLSPPELLRLLQKIELMLGRRRHRRWGARSMDIDIILWSGGKWTERRLVVPHSAFRLRDFVLRPLTAIAAGWRDPATGLAMRHLHVRLKKPRKRLTGPDAPIR